MFTSVEVAPSDNQKGPIVVLTYPKHIVETYVEFGEMTSGRKLIEVANKIVEVPSWGFYMEAAGSDGAHDYYEVGMTSDKTGDVITMAPADAVELRISDSLICPDHEYLHVVISNAVILEGSEGDLEAIKASVDSYVKRLLEHIPGEVM